MEETKTAKCSYCQVPFEKRHRFDLMCLVCVKNCPRCGTGKLGNDLHCGPCLQVYMDMREKK